MHVIGHNDIGQCVSIRRVVKGTDNQAGYVQFLEKRLSLKSSEGCEVDTGFLGVAALAKVLCVWAIKGRFI